MDFDLDTIASVLDTLAGLLPHSNAYLAVASAALLGVGLVLKAVSKSKKDKAADPAYKASSHELAPVAVEPAAPPAKLAE